MATINGLKKMGKRNERTVPGITMWTMVAIRLTHLIFQYSGEPEACTLNTADQNAHILKNFDLNGKRNFCFYFRVHFIVKNPIIFPTFSPFFLRSIFFLVSILSELILENG